MVCRYARGERSGDKVGGPTNSQSVSRAQPNL